MTLRERITDMVAQLGLRHQSPLLSPEEMSLGVWLRSNDEAYESLLFLIESRIEARASSPEPSDPLDCKSMVARDRELRWLLNHLEFLYQTSGEDIGDHSELN